MRFLVKLHSDADRPQLAPGGVLSDRTTLLRGDLEEFVVPSSVSAARKNICTEIVTRSRLKW